MLKIYKIIVLLIFVSYTSTSVAHVQHYDNLKRIEFDIYRNNKYIGKHIFSFKKLDEQLAVKSEINFEIKKLGIVLYKYDVSGTEIYKDGELVKFNSKTKFLKFSNSGQCKPLNLSPIGLDGYSLFNFL